MFNRITIIGLGLIGGSLGLAIKQRRLAKEVVGVSRRKTTIRRAGYLGVVDTATSDLKKGVEGSGLVILTVPVLTIIDIAKEISPYLEKGAILTDAGSTKKDVTRKIEPFLPSSVKFVGSHPLTGSEKSGVNFACKNLFKGAYCILTRTNRTDVRALRRLKEFWHALGMKVEIMSPQMHDRVLSGLSHLPHAAAVALTNTADRKYLYLAAGGFRDTTRIASGEPELWKDIFATNRMNITKDIRRLKKELSKIESALKKNNGKELLRLLEKAKVIRDSMK
jgi:prephenate dehydrogenase